MAEEREILEKMRDVDDMYDAAKKMQYGVAIIEEIEATREKEKFSSIWAHKRIRY